MQKKNEEFLLQFLHCNDATKVTNDKTTAMILNIL